MKNISNLDDLAANLSLPATQLKDLRNIMKNRSFTSRLENAKEIDIGKVRISKLQETKDKNTGFLLFKYKGRDIRFYYDSKNRLAETLGMINDEFIDEESARLKVKGKDVIDIGAYDADTAICYVANGAEHVYALEPYPYYYELGVKNVKANKLTNKITMINAGCSSRNGKILISSSSSSFTIVGPAKEGKKSGKQIDIISLAQLVKKYHLNNAVLKIDCEGCEYDIIFGTSPSILRCFSEIQIEYHYGYSNLEKRLKDLDFKVKHTRPTKKYNFTSKSFMVLGFLNAKRL